MRHPAVWSAADTRFGAIRLMPGRDLRGRLEEVFAETGASAGFVVSCVGSLTDAQLRFADRVDATPVPGPLEIVHLAGTFGPDGAHLHLSVADSEGLQRGGHLMRGSLIRTTAEVVFAVTESVAFARMPCVESGYAELVPSLR